MTAVAVLHTARYAARACLPRKRRLGLLLPAVGAILFGLLAHVVDADTAEESFGVVAAVGLFAIVLPIGCLVIGDAMLGTEVRSGTLHFTWLSPVPRWAIVAGRWATGTLAAAIVLGGASALAAVVAGVPEVAPHTFLAVSAGAAAYIALFIMLGAITRRAVVWSLGVVVLGERLLGAALDGIAQLSPGWLARTAFTGFVDTDLPARLGVPDGWAAIGRLAVVTAVCLAVASWRLASIRLSGRGE